MRKFLALCPAHPETLENENTYFLYHEHMFTDGDKQRKDAKSVCDQFVNKVCQNLEARFLDTTDQNILAALGCILDPSCYPENEQSLAEYGASEIDLLESHCAAILPEEANCTTEFDNFKRIVHRNFK